MSFFFKVLLFAYLFVEADFLLEPHYQFVLCSFRCELISFNCNFLFLRFFSLWITFFKVLFGMGFFFKVLLFAYLFVEADFLLEPHYRLVLCSFHCELISFNCNFLFLRFFSVWVSFIKVLLFAYLFVEADFLLLAFKTAFHFRKVLVSVIFANGICNGL